MSVENPPSSRGFLMGKQWKTLSEVKPSHSRLDGFVVYDHSSRNTFDDRSRQLMDQLHAKFQHVEFNDVEGKKWCVRVVRSTDLVEQLPLAAIGKTPHQAAERLWRISTFFD